MLGLSGSFRACFKLLEQLNPGPENIKSGLNRAVRPPYGLKLFENVATGPRMPLEALNGQKLFKTPKTVISGIFGLGPSPTPESDSRWSWTDAGVGLTPE